MAGGQSIDGAGDQVLSKLYTLFISSSQKCVFNFKMKLNIMYVLFINDQAAGVKPMSITGRMVRERERLTGMTPEERAWRKKWLKDQILSPNEPKYIKELHSEAFNPIRRFYRYPLDFVFHRVLQPFIVSFETFVVYRTNANVV